MELLEQLPELGWYLAAIQLMGVLSACLVRATEGMTGHTICQQLFLLSLALVGAATLVSLSIGHGHFMVAGSTLAIMTVAATWTPSSHQPQVY